MRAPLLQPRLNHPRLLLGVLLLAATVLACAWSTATASAATSGRLEQCENGKLSEPHACAFEASDWISGNLNANNSHYFEGDAIPYRMVFGGLSTTTPTSVTLEWDTTESGKHAIDYLTSYNRTETTANPCKGIASCTFPGTPSTFPIPLDPAVTAAGVDQGDAPASPGRFTLFGGTITAVGPILQSGTYAGTSKSSVVVTFLPSQADPVLAWGGHIATRLDWGQNNSAVAINGSPYHMRETTFGGNQDRSASSDAIIYPGSLTVTKDAQPDSGRDFPFTATGTDLSDFTLDDDADPTRKNFATFRITTFDAKSVTEADPSPEWALDSITCTESGGLSAANSTRDVSTRTASLVFEEGENIACTFVNKSVPGTLRVIKQVSNDNGGTLGASAFTLNVKDGDGDHVGVSPEAGSSAGTLYTLPAGDYTVSEDSPTSLGYAMTGITGDCASSGAVTVTAGQTKTCTITNDDIAPKLTVKKAVVNDNGGTRGASAFTLNVKDGNGDHVGVSPEAGSSAGTLYTLSAGTYTVSEDSPASLGYAMTGISGDCSAAGAVTLSVGDELECTLTNDDIAPELTVIKRVINDDGGTATAGDFTMDVDDPGSDPASQAGAEAPGVKFPVDPGAYTVSESGGPTGYAESRSADCAGSIAIGQKKTCTITNDDIAPKLTVIKRVVNDDGGTATAGDFTMDVDDPGSDPASQAGADAPGVGFKVDPGAYSVSESGGPSGYAESKSAECAGSIAIGETKTCTITNDDIAPKLIVKKSVVGGTAQASDFTMLVTGTDLSDASFPGTETGETVTLKAGPYEVDESASGPGGYTKTRSADCVATAVIGETKTCTITNTRDQGQLEVRKNLLPAGDAGRFDLQIDGKADPGNEGQNVGDGGSTGAETLDTGTYSVREVAAAGTSLADYDSEIVCKDATGTTVASAAGAGPLDVRVGKDDDIVCAVTNTRLGRIEVEERVVGDSAASFSFATVSPAGGTPLGGTFSLTDGQTTPGAPGLPGKVLPSAGAYEIAQAAKTGFRLTGLACVDATGDTVASRSARTASVKVAPGETVKCTFTNEKVDAQPILVKAGNIDAFHGDQLTFTFTVNNTGNGPISDVTLTDDKCSNVTGPTRSGGNADALLDPRETWVYTCTMPAPEHSAGEANPLVNVATVTGTDEFGRTLTSEDRHETRLLHPAIAADKDGPAEADAGAEATFTYAVTNAGDTPLDGVELVDDKCSAVTGPVKQSSNEDDRLDPGERWLYECTLTLPTEGESLVNTATATGTARAADEPAQRRAAAIRTLSATDVHTTKLRYPTPTPTPTPTPAPLQISGEPAPIATPTQQIQSVTVASPRPKRGKAKLQSPTGCRSQAFEARVTGDQIASVTFTIDGKRVARVSKASRSGAWEYAVRPKGYDFGTHRLLAKVAFKSASQTKAKRLTRTFIRCGRPAAKPQFTG